MSYLIIPTAGGASHRRVDFGSIAELFVEDEFETVAQPSGLLRAASALRRLAAPLSETLTLLRDEVLARKLHPNQPAPGIARAFGI